MIITLSGSSSHQRSQRRIFTPNTDTHVRIHTYVFEGFANASETETDYCEEEEKEDEKDHKGGSFWKGHNRCWTNKSCGRSEEKVKWWKHTHVHTRDKKRRIKEDEPDRGGGSELWPLNRMSGLQIGQDWFADWHPTILTHSTVTVSICQSVSAHTHLNSKKRYFHVIGIKIIWPASHNDIVCFAYHDFNINIQIGNMWSLYAGDASTDIKPQGDFVSLYLH